MTRTLWDLLTPNARVTHRPAERNHPASRPTPVAPVSERYLDMQRSMLSRYGVRVRKWRANTSGVAWQITYTDGRVARLIESPRPRGPVSAAVFLHEIGHHAIGFNVYRPRCLEELKAWCFSLDQMEAWNIAVTDRVRKRVHESLAYAVDKAVRRGMRTLPGELMPYAAFDRRNSCFVDPRTNEANGPD